MIFFFLFLIQFVSVSHQIIYKVSVGNGNFNGIDFVVYIGGNAWAKHGTVWDLQSSVWILTGIEVFRKDRL